MDNKCEKASFLKVVLRKVPFALDYMISESEKVVYTVGKRIYVPYRQTKLLGFIVAVNDQSDYDKRRLRSPVSCIDDRPLLSQSTLAHLQTLSVYYHEDIASIYQQALPDYMWRGQGLERLDYWCLGKSSVSNHRLTSAQKKVITLFDRNDCLSTNQILSQSVRSATLASLVDYQVLAKSGPLQPKSWTLPDLSQKQREVSDSILEGDSKKVQYLFGVTGSGKTHIYLHIANRWIQSGGQVIWLLPEIGLTPQLVHFLHQVIPVGQVVTIHSGLTVKQKNLAHQLAFSGEARLIIGTRSAVFTQVKDLRGIIMDEEHDTSYKQQSGWRYSARGVACMRAKSEKIPILLGSATPSLSCLALVKHNKVIYHKLLHQGARLPDVELVEAHKSQQLCGIQRRLLDHAGQVLKEGGKVLFFINRRGFAPALWCEVCHHIATCSACDKAFTYYQSREVLKCHICEREQALSLTCQKCGKEACAPVGAGTEKIARFLESRFSSYQTVQMDKDTCPTWTQLQEKIRCLHKPSPQVIVATQMLVKSHNIPNLKMVVVLDADKALYSKDFRAQEFLIQQMHQVTGRAGRDGGDSKVFIQTFHVDHPIWRGILNHAYESEAYALLEKREKAALPPYSSQGLILFTGENEEGLYLYADLLKKQVTHQDVVCFSPMPSLNPKKDHKYCVVLLLQAKKMTSLHKVLQVLYQQAKLKAHKNNWGCSIDIDPIDW